MDDKTRALVERLRSGDPRANFWKLCADTIEAQARRIEELEHRVRGEEGVMMPTERTVADALEARVAQQALRIEELEELCRALAGKDK